MNQQQALNVLGLKPGASDDEIITAHRQLMQKFHPDRGGNDFIASQINDAKDVLLGKRGS
jgi:curved DNA-binding protein CbpA